MASHVGQSSAGAALLIGYVSPAMNWFRKKLQEWRCARATLAFVRDFHAQSRARQEQLASEGRFEEIRRDHAALFGSTDSNARARLVSVGGIDVSANSPRPNLRNPE
jgi:hypothetical protein